MSQQAIFLKTFNTQFEAFLNDINDVFPNNTALIKTRNSLLTLKKFNPKLLIGVWYDYIWSPYKEDITNENIEFFISKDYSQDLQYMEDAKDIMKEIDNFRKPISEMDDVNRGHCMKYIKNLSLLSERYKNN